MTENRTSCIVQNCTNLVNPGTSEYFCRHHRATAEQIGELRRTVARLEARNAALELLVETTPAVTSETRRVEANQ